MLRGVTRASVRAGGDMGPNRLRQTRAKAQYGTFWSRAMAAEHEVTFPKLILSRMTGPKVVSLAEVATIRFPVLHSGPGGGPEDGFRGLPAAEGGGWRCQCTGVRRGAPADGKHSKNPGQKAYNGPK